MTEIETRLAEIEARLQVGAPRTPQFERTEKLALVKALRRALEAFEKTRNMRWGWDGDCGLSNIIESADDDIADILRQDQPPSMHGATGGEL